MTYTGTIRYLECPGLFDGGKVEFSLADCPAPAQATCPESSVYDRARRDFNQAGYMYPAPPLFLGTRDIVFPPGTLYILRLLLKAPGTDFIVPEKISFLANYLKECTAYQKAYFPGIENRFVYLTVRSGIVQSMNEDSFHVDGFQGVAIPRHIPEQNYIWSDIHPTIYALQPYFIEPLDPGLHNVHTAFDRATDKKNVYSGVEKGLYIIDPYHVHARPPVPAGTQRSFVRLCFSPVEIRDDTNMVNKWLPRGPYNREDIRNKLTSYEGPAGEGAHGLRPAPLKL